MDRLRHRRGRNIDRPYDEIGKMYIARSHSQIRTTNNGDQLFFFSREYPRSGKTGIGYYHRTNTAPYQSSFNFVIIARYNHTTQNLNCRLSLDEVKDLINDKVTNDAKYIEQIETAVEKKKSITSDDFVCSVCHSSICITENGDIYPCAGWQSYVIGNVRKTPINDIWNNSEKVQYLRNLRNKDFPKCIKCPDKEYCTMCMVRNANESPTGDPLTVNEYFCSIAKFNKEITLEWKDKSKNTSYK